jgi:hypothetical protein
LKLWRAGVIPANLQDQGAAQKLAMCNDIGEAAYVDSLVAAELVEMLRELPSASRSLSKLAFRYGISLRPAVTGGLLCPFANLSLGWALCSYYHLDKDRSCFIAVHRFTFGPCE